MWKPQSLTLAFKDDYFRFEKPASVKRTGDHEPVDGDVLDRKLKVVVSARISALASDSTTADSMMKTDQANTRPLPSPNPESLEPSVRRPFLLSNGASNWPIASAR
jgi:hypothetical protein